jgi:outer membrane protein assembly factor BamE
MPFSTSFRSLSAGLLAASAVLLLGACSSMSDGVADFAGFITPYRVEVVQGNVITREQLATVKPGQSREQVRQNLGAPLLADPFHGQRWDYVFLIRRQGTPSQQRSVVVSFDGDVVKSVEAPELPSEQEFVASISQAKPVDSQRKLELTPEERAALPQPVRPEAAPNASAPLGAVRTYPPLEPQ